MINTTMKNYPFFTLGTEDEYGQTVLSTEPQGEVKLSINLTSQSTQNNINYKNSTYVGLTFDTNINDKYVIVYGDMELKVQYVNKAGRYIQVFMGEFNG